MKLNVNAKELLALYNLLHDRFEGPGPQMKEPQDGDDLHLYQVHNRLKAWLIAALSNKQVDPVESFLAREQVKIDKLKDQNEDVKRAGQELADVIRNDPDFFVPQDGEDYTAPEYPRRGRSGGRGGNRGGNKR